MAIVVGSTSDPGLALEVGGPLLLPRPEQNTIILSALGDAMGEPDGGRYWWACRDDVVVGFAMHSAQRFPAVLAAAEDDAVEALVDTMAVDAPELPGVTAEAGTAAAFAGRWAQARHAPARPVEAQRLHRIHTVRHPDDVVGTARSAVPADRPLLVLWAAAFERDIEADHFDPGRFVDRHLSAGRLWVWDVDGAPVSMAAVKAGAGGVARIVVVYTPPAHRGHGYAAACVAALSEWVLAAGTGCVLLTQLHNPTSNSVYRRIGSETIAEVLIYRFG